MSERKKYNLFIPREYTDNAGDKKTHFWQVGVLLPMQQRDGFSIKLYSNLLVTKGDMVAFPDLRNIERPNKQEKDDVDPDDDDIPF